MAINLTVDQFNAGEGNMLGTSDAGVLSYNFATKKFQVAPHGGGIVAEFDDQAAAVESFNTSEQPNYIQNVGQQSAPTSDLAVKLNTEIRDEQLATGDFTEMADGSLRYDQGYNIDTPDQLGVNANSGANYDAGALTQYDQTVLDRVGTGIGSGFSAGSVRPGSTSFGGQPAQDARTAIQQTQRDDVVRRSDEGPSGGYPQFVQDPVPRAADIGRADPQTFVSPIATEYDSFDMDSFAGDALDQFGQTTGIDSVESIRLQREAFDKYQAEQAALGGDPNEPRSDDNPAGYTGMQRAEPQYQDMISEVSQPFFGQKGNGLGNENTTNPFMSEFKEGLSVSTPSYMTTTNEDMTGQGGQGSFQGLLGQMGLGLGSGTEQQEMSDRDKYVESKADYYGMINPGVETPQAEIDAMRSQFGSEFDADPSASSSDLQSMLDRGTELGASQAGFFSGDMVDYFKSLQPESGDGSRIAPEISTTNLGVSSLGDASSNDLQRMLNRGTLATGTVSDVQDRIDPTGERAQREPTAPVPQFFDGMGDGPQFLNMGDGYGAGIDAAIPGDQTNGENLPSSGAPNPIIDVLGTGNVLDPGTSGLARAGSASDFGVQDTFNPDMMSNLQSSSMQLPSFGQAMQPQASLPQGGLGSLSQPIPSLQQFNISGSYNAPPIKSPFV